MTPKGRETLLDLVKAHLREVGYEEVEPNPSGGGVWAGPPGATGEGRWTDKILPTIQDCFERGL